MDAGTVFLIAGTVTFAFTTVLTIAGVGAAFILIPVFLALGIGLHPAMAAALLLNVLAMFFACLRFIPARLVDFRAALPILIVATVLSPREHGPASSRISSPRIWPENWPHPEME